MNRPRTILGTLLAFAVLALAPSSALAETLTFVNDTKSTLVVQLAVSVRGGIRRERPYQLAPGEKVDVTLDGLKLLSVSDVKQPNRTLYQATYQPSKKDATLSIKPGRSDFLGRPTVTVEPVKPSPAPTKPAPRDP